MKMFILLLSLLLTSHLALASEQLIDAAETGDVAQVEKLIGEGNNVNYADLDGNTALMLAAWHGRIEVVNALLEHSDILINQTNNHGQTALMWAARKGRIEVVQALLARPEIQINEAGRSSRTALMWAAWHGRIEVVNALLEHSDILINQTNKNGQTALMEAAAEGRIEVVQALLARPEILINHADKDGITALMMAALSGKIEVVQALLAQPESNINHTTKKVQTAVSLAIMFNHCKIAQLLQNIIDARAHSHLISLRIQEITGLPPTLSDVITNYLTGLDDPFQKNHIGFSSATFLDLNEEERPGYQSPRPPQLRRSICQRVSESCVIQ